MIYSGKNIDVDGLNLLISSEIEVESHTTTGCKELTHLNLSGSIRSSLTLEKLQKFWSVPSTLTSMTAGNSDLELFAPSGIPVMLPLVSRFPHLSYLSLLHPGCVSWPSFLRLAPNLVILTHLCLAYWPTLELDSTNNQHPHRLGRVSSDLNTKSDGDWSNAAAVLAILCKHSRQLRWLDLEGCAQWLPALTWHDNKRPSVDWNGAWGSVEYLNLSQGPMLVGVHLEGGSETTAWLQVEREIQHIEALIVGSRAEAGDGKISIDRGWEKGSFISYLI
ncbi:hypothetical protein MMC14_005299 [Varicellaria rhodocarpa]|nr:hypothetical protein [Varicellaria rhodocarpa]